MATSLSFFLFRFYLFTFLERKEGRERERERNMNVYTSQAPPLGTWPANQACALTGNRTRDPLVHRAAPTSLYQEAQRVSLAGQPCGQLKLCGYD